MTRIKGSYKALDGGFTVEAMRDFTGGVSETYELNKEPPNLFKIMLNSFQRKSLMCGAIYKQQKLVRYSISYKIEFLLILSMYYKLYEIYSC